MNYFHRCSWVNLKNPRYVIYHDYEWGKPQHFDDKLFEILILEIFQEGLSFECVLNKRESFRIAFSSFNPKVVAEYNEAKIDELMHDSGLIRNRRKIEATISNAKVFVQIQKEFVSFDRYLWNFTSGKTIKESYNIATKSSLSDLICKDLKKRGMKHIGSITIYSYLQAVGIINGHLDSCDFQNDSDFFIRTYQEQDLKEIIDLFYHTVHAINKKDYTEEQLNAWAPKNGDLNRWNTLLSEHFTIVAVYQNQIVGFGDITSTGYLDHLYVHYQFQGKGIATRIVDLLEMNSFSKIEVHASLTAKPFFEKRGYIVVKEQQVKRNGIFLKNYVMEKTK